MPTLTNPSEIARETFRLLAQRRIPPTPDNFRALYMEVSGDAGSGEGFPDKTLRSLADGLPKDTPDQQRLARELEQALRGADWNAYRGTLLNFVTTLSATQRLAWGKLIGELIRRLESRHGAMSSTRKRESLDHVLESASNPDTLFNRLQGLLRSWRQAEGEPSANAAVEVADNLAEEEAFETVPDTQASPATVPAVPKAGSEALLSELRDIFAFTLESAIAPQIRESAQLTEEARGLARDIRATATPADLEQFSGRLKHFARQLEVLAEDQSDLHQGLLKLVQLLLENVGGMVEDDHWLQGQIEVLRAIVEQPLSIRIIEDAERRLKEVIFKQSQLEVGLVEAKDALKNMLAGFVDQLAEFSDATSDYHDKIESCADRISTAQDVREIGSVLSEVMQETRAMQESAQHSRDELRQTQERVRTSEERIRQLESELEITSDLVRYDQLTGALNRRGMEEMLQKEVGRAERHESQLCIGLLDIDDFKRINDSLGHDAGDDALIHLAKLCRATLRPQDTVARYGGEEFVVLLPETGLEDATTALVRLQRELTKHFFLHDNQKVLITFSAGVTRFHAGEPQANAVKRADTAMYQAKQSGKNRVVSVE
ncbi:MAG: diguanylate cyclase [Rhodocyclaceae bacterium]|nr:diguanylate cyclase [Rhodocyclaceae bacterium]